MSASRSSAYHEAGHAVVAYVVGLPFTSVDVNETETRHGYLEVDKARAVWSSRLLTKQAMVGLAGNIAERKFDSESDPDRIGASGDIQAVGKLLGYSWRNREEWQQLVSAAYALSKNAVEENWSAIEAVAERLLERQRLTADEVAAIVDQALSPQNPEVTDSGSGEIQ